MRLLEAALDTSLDSPLFAGLSVHGLHFTVYASSNYELGALLSKHFAWGGGVISDKMLGVASVEPVAFVRLKHH